MESMLIPKVWKMDYSFIIKNYLNEKLWEKTWTLFQYKQFTIELTLNNINVKSKRIGFDIKVRYHNLEEGDRNNYFTDDAYYTLSINDISFLKRAINSAVFNCIRGVERLYFIRNTEEWEELDNQVYEEERKLSQYANDFLDEVGVTSDACREAYIDAYVDENAKMRSLKIEYEDNRLYHELTDFYLIWLETIKDDNRYEQWKNLIQSNISNDEWKSALEEAREHIKYIETEEFEEDMKSNLVEV